MTTDANNQRSDKPVILYGCIHNAGRSVAAKVITEYLASGRVVVRSAGSMPSDSVNPQVAAVLFERGLTTQGEVPKLMSVSDVAEADVVVTMGCGQTCPIFPGKRYMDWDVEDPAGQPIEQVREIVSDIERRVVELLGEVGLNSQ